MTEPKKNEIRRDLLEQAQRTGRVQFVRVSPSIIARVQRRLDNVMRKAYRDILADEVHCHPSLGKTLK